MALRWSGPVGAYSRMTGDRRMIREGALTSRTLPMPLRYSPTGGHADASDVGGMTSLSLNTNPIMASGFFLPSGLEPLTEAAIYKARAGINGPSLEMEPGSFEGGIVRHDDGKAMLEITKGHVMAVALVSKPAIADVRFNVFDDAMTSAGTVSPEQWMWEEFPDSEALDLYALIAAGVNTNWRGHPIAPREAVFKADDAIKRIAQWAAGDAAKFATAFLWQDPNGAANSMSSYRLPIGDIIDGKLTVIYHAIYAAAALIQGAHGGLPTVPDTDKARLRSIINQMYQAFGKSFGEDLEPPWDQGNTKKALSMTDTVDVLEASFVAGGGALAPSKHLFEDPKLTGPTRVTITPSGQVFGHIANWGVCHTGIGNACVDAPHSKLGYAKFHQGTVLTAEGEELPVGKITLGGGHADKHLGIIPTMEHYDNSTTAVAVVRAGEDEYGIWFAGSMLPGVSDERVAELRRSPLSGDWRRDQSVNNLELIAALAVNSPGFPISGIVAGAQMSLVAAGMVVDMPDDGDQVAGSEVPDAALEVAASDGPGEESASEAAREQRLGKLAAFAAADQMHRRERLAKMPATIGEE